MTAITSTLNAVLLQALGDRVIWHSDPNEKPLCVNLAPPHPPRLRIYMYSLVGGVGTVRPNEYKIVLRVPGQSVRETASFYHTGDRLAIVCGYREDLDVFILWDASLHREFKNGSNVQVRDTTVLEAAASGWAVQERLLASGTIELVIACQSFNLIRALDDRLAWTGGIVAKS